MCGAPLRLACPGCGADQPAAATFCSECGTDLRASPGGDDAVDERQERRVVTVLFADLAGSTALGEKLDPEDVRELQGELFGLINREVERYGGTTEKFAGDAVLAVFGIPLAHEDDAERAVRTALALQAGFGSFVERVRGRHGADVALRIGVNTGDVVAGRESAARGELMVSGDAVNVAARLQQHAQPGEVLAGQRTQSATSRTISYREHEPIAAKGKSEPVAAWVAVSAASELEPSPRGLGGLAAPLVGRDEELAVLTAVAARVERERAPQLVTLFGPAGVGKSRLLAELVARLPEARLVKGRCLPYGEEITLWPLAEAAKAHAGILDTDPAEVALVKLRGAVESVVPADQVERVLEAAAWTIGFSLPGGSNAGIDPHEAVRRLQEGWRRYVAALGREQPTVVAIEDIHWASGSLLDLIEQLAETLADTKVLLVCTARLEVLEQRPTWGAGKQNATALSLAPLSAADSGRLVSSLLGEAEIPEGVRDRVLASAEGNPFYLEEMLNMLIEQGALERRNGGWASTERLAEVSIPDSVQGVIAARIDLLEGEPRDALRRCSAVGRTFWPAAVGVDDSVISSLVRSGLVSDSLESVVAGTREFAFKHALTRDVAYATLPRPERRELHRRIAEWIQEMAPDRGGETVELAAYHYGQALAYGEDDPAVSRRAFELLIAASKAAFARAAFHSARLQLERARELAADDVQRADAEIGLAQLDMTEALLSRSLERLDAAEALLGHEDAPLLAEALALRSRVCWLSGRWDEALVSSNRAVEALAGLPESPQLARALARRSQLEMLKQKAESVEHAREAAAVARRVGDAFAEVNARINIFTQEAADGVPPDPNELAAIIDEAAKAGVYEEAFRAIVNFTWSANGFIPLDRLELLLWQLRHRLGEVEAPLSIGPYLELSRAMVILVPTGSWVEATRVIEAQPSDISATSHLVRLWVAGGLAFRRGDLETAEPLLAELRPEALGSGEPQRIIPMACAVLPWLAHTDRKELRVATEEVLDHVDRAWPPVLDSVPVVRALAAAEETDLLARVTASIGATPTLGALSRTAVIVGEALLALLEGRAAAAVAPLEEAVERQQALRRTYDAACLELELARALEAAGRADEAREVQVRVDAVLEPLGCVNPF
jgi:class 3 adenylate cyclase